MSSDLRLHQDPVWNAIRDAWEDRTTDTGSGVVDEIWVAVMRVSGVTPTAFGAALDRFLRDLNRQFAGKPYAGVHEAECVSTDWVRVHNRCGDNRSARFWIHVPTGDIHPSLGWNDPDRDAICSNLFSR